MEPRVIHYLTKPERSMERAKACCAREDWEKAIENYREAIELLAPGDEMVGDAEVGIAYCLLNQDKATEASHMHYVALMKYRCKERARVLSEAFEEDKRRRYNRELKRRLDRIRVVR